MLALVLIQQLFHFVGLTDSEADKLRENLVDPRSYPVRLKGLRRCVENRHHNGAESSAEIPFNPKLIAVGKAFQPFLGAAHDEWQLFWTRRNFHKVEIHYR